MAKATKTVFKEEVVTIKKTHGYTLELNQDEADTLYMILMKVGGHPDTTRRGFSAAVLDALRRADPSLERRHNYTTLASWFSNNSGLIFNK